MHYVKYKKWWDTKTFNQVGTQWLQDGRYCPFPEGTNSYYEFWDEQEHYIHNGFEHEGQRIAGLHYLYLNFCPIKDKKKKLVTFPQFWSVDADYFLELENIMGLGPGEVDEFRPVIFEVSKSRQVGASLKGVVPLLYNMNFVPFSQNYIGSYLSGDTQKTVEMFLTYFYHTQQYCEFGKRFLVQQKYEYYMTGYMEEKDGEKIPAGYKSELRTVTWKDNPEKGVGGACDLFIVEEAGLHPHLLTSLKFITPACKDGDYTTGNILVYGAAGKEGQCEDLKKLHFNPSAYDAKEYDNIWEPDSHYKKSGYFIPNYSCRKGHIDDDGNPNPETAIAARNNKIAKLEKTDYENYLLELSQYPNTPSEMFNSRGRKRFNTKLLANQIAYLEANQIYGQAVELSEDRNGAIKWEFVDEAYHQPIRIYPLPPDQSKEGCVEIFEFPDPDPIEGLYIGAIDSYNHEDAYYSDSLGSVFIYKKASSLAGEGTGRVVVAEYCGRPKSKNDFYKICAMLAKMYNAVLMPENEDQELTPWFVNNGYEDLLADQPDIIRGYVKESKVKRSKGINASTPLIIAAENKIARYIDEKMGDILEEDPKTGEWKVVGQRYGVNRILPLGLLYELKEYVHDKNKNFDRVRSFGWTLMYEDETHLHQIKEYDDEVAKFFTNTKRFAKRQGSSLYQFTA